MQLLCYYLYVTHEQNGTISLTLENHPIVIVLRHGVVQYSGGLQCRTPNPS